MKVSNIELTDGVFASGDIQGPAAVVSLVGEPQAKLFVNAPLPEPLSFGRVVIHYRTENLRIVPVYGSAAMDVSPRIGHLHITVDDLPWHWLDASGEPLTLNGYPAGKHTILIELADPMHRIIDSKLIEFIIPPHQ